jgi:uncharacterized protein (TIGR02722 family)
MKKLLFLPIVLAWLISCGSVERVDTNTVTDLSGQWNDTDTRLSSEYLVNSALGRSWLKNYSLDNYGKKPVVMVAVFNNETSEHFDTDLLVQQMESEFVNSGSVRMVANKQLRDALRKERGEQQNGMVSEDTVKRFGKELGADFMMFGTVKMSYDKAGNTTAKLYQVDARLISIETNEIVWVDNWKGKKIVKDSSSKW